MLTPEERLVALVAHRVVDRDVVAEAVRRVGEWERVLGLGARHGVLPLLAAHLGGLAVPQAVARKLAVGQIQMRQRNQTNVAELVRFTAAIEQRGVAYALYKGAVVAQRYYGDVALRDYSDFDILVNRESLAAVDDAIRELGYSLLLYPDAHAQADNRRKGCEESWSSAAGGVLDLHWSLTDDFFPIRLTTAELLSRSATEHLPDGDVRTFCDEDNLIVLATHAAKHFFERLEWLTTVGEVMTRPDLDWTAIVERVTRGGCATSVTIACRLAARVLGYPLPAALSSMRVREAEVEDLVRHFERELFAERDGGAEALISWRANLRLFDRRFDGLRASMLMVFAPRVADANAMPLPPRWRWLYYLVRPLRLVAKYVRRLVG